MNINELSHHHHENKSLIRSKFVSSVNIVPELLVVTVDDTFSKLAAELPGCKIQVLSLSRDKSSNSDEWDELCNDIASVVQYLSETDSVFNGIFVCVSNPDALIFGFLWETFHDIVPVLETSGPSLVVGCAITTEDKVMIVTEKDTDVDLLKLPEDGTESFISLCCADVKAYNNFLVSKSKGREMQVANGIILALVTLKNLCYRNSNGGLKKGSEGSKFSFVLPVSGDLVVDVFADHCEMQNVELCSLDEASASSYIEDLYTLAINTTSSAKKIQSLEFSSNGISILDACEVGYSKAKDTISCPLTSWIRSVVAMEVLSQKKFCLVTFGDELQRTQEKIIYSCLPEKYQHLFLGTVNISGINIDSWVSNSFEINGTKQFGEEEHFHERMSSFERACLNVVERFGLGTGVIFGCSCTATELQHISNPGVELLNGFVDSIFLLRVINESNLYNTKILDTTGVTAKPLIVLEEAPTLTKGCTFGISMIVKNTDDEFVESRLLTLYEKGVLTKETPLLLITTQFLYRLNCKNAKEKKNLNRLVGNICSTYKNVLQKLGHDRSKYIICDVGNLVNQSTIDAYVETVLSPHIKEDSALYSLSDSYAESNGGSSNSKEFLIEELWFHHFGIVLNPTIELGGISFSDYVYFTSSDNVSCKLMVEEANMLFRSKKISPPSLGWAVNKIFPLENKMICTEEGVFDVEKDL